jgi:hypothetical protein
VVVKRGGKGILMLLRRKSLVRIFKTNTLSLVVLKFKIVIT